ncbi:MAG: alpha/beta hydrolase [Bacteroidia bacterium]
MIKTFHYYYAFALLAIFVFTNRVSAQDLTIPLWENGAPGFEKLKDEPEQAKDWWVRNIHNPSIVVFHPPKEIATGAAIVVCPGGGHRNLVYNSEGRDPALFLNKLGITAIVLKYRLTREENSPYDLEKQPREDAFRAMRLVRSKAKEWNIDPDRIGIMGFSAGGEVVSSIVYESGEGNADAEDPVDRMNGKPDFQILIYPGPLWIPNKIPSDAPPAFLLAAIDDMCCAGPIVRLIENYYQAGIPAEAHIYAKGNHAFNMGYRSELKSISSWPQRLADWLEDSGISKPKE